MDNVIIICVLALIVGFAVWYIYKSKKSGRKCIGCPDSGACASRCSGNCSGCSGSCGCKES